MKSTKDNNTAAQVIQEILGAEKKMKDLRASLTFATPLSPSERRSYTAGSTRSRGMNTLTDRLAAARQHQDLLPHAFDLPQFEQDAEQTRALEQCLLAALELEQDIRDTYLTVGGRAIRSAKLAYEHLRVSLAGSDQLKRDVTKMTKRVIRTPRRVTAPAPANANAPAPAPEAPPGNASPPGNAGPATTAGTPVPVAAPVAPSVEAVPAAAKKVA